MDTRTARTVTFLWVCVATGLLTLVTGCGEQEDGGKAEADPPSRVTVVPDPKDEVRVVEEHKAAVFAFYVEVDRQRTEAYLKALHRAARVEKRTTTTTTTPRKVSRPKVTGVAPSDAAACVQRHESGGDYRAENPTSTASGAYQFVDGTWNNYGGYRHASDAPPEVQDRKFAETWAGGAGRGHWAGSGC